MARQARDRSQLKVYHAILRGVNKQQIFECTEDYEHFIRILQRQCGLPVETRPSKIKKGNSYLACLENGSEDMPFELESEEAPSRHCYLYAWCLMGNHVHLLLKESDEEIGEVMKRISSSYVYYYNHKYDRVGHLFQERFKSQPVEDWEYFVTLLRYIHQNPLKPHLVNDLKDYRWSSWNEYLGTADVIFTSVEPVLSRISLTELNDLIVNPLSEVEEEGLIDVEVRPHKSGYSDDDVWQLLKKYSGTSNASEFQRLPRPLQKHYLYMLHEEGIGPRILSRLTGVTYSVVQKATSASNEKFIQEQYLKLHSSSMVCDSNEDDDEWMSYFSPDEFERYPEY